MTQQPTKHLYIKTYGCQMNVYDSGRMGDVLAEQGFATSDNPNNADLVILNTCHIREKASEKMYSELGRIRQQKEKRKAEGKPMLIAVAGCVAQAEGEEIIRRAPYVDLVVGPQSYQRLPEMVRNAEAAHRGSKAEVVSLDFAADNKFDVLPESSTPQGVSAFLTIQEGCDKFCTFCVVPYTRGAEYSRTAPEIYREALKLVGQGAREITLLGQNVNAWHGKGPDREDWNFAQLIRHLSDIPQLKRIRYTTSHPRDVDAEQIAVHGEVEKLMPFLHLPVQSGSDNILKEMNRKHTAADYLRTIEAFRNARPDIQFSSDFIVGFPGETDADFKQTMKLVEDVEYAQAYSFAYSARPGTPAAIREDSVPESVKKERLQELQALLNQQQLAFNASCVGKTIPVLFDRKGKHEGQIVGRSPWMQAVHVDNASDCMGALADIYLTQAHPNGMTGEVSHNTDDSLQAAYS